jgi:SAM-dependent methyltransferase
MNERTGGVRAVLSAGGVYSFFQSLISKPDNREKIVRTYIRPQPGDRILDVGCGPADILDLLPDVDYHGFDHSQRYIDKARARHGPRGSFHCGDVSEVASQEDGTFDIALALGLLHHIDDESAARLMETIWRLLKPGGRLITVDPAITGNQSALARYIVTRDRGQHVRSPDAYLALANRRFADVRANERSDLLRIPYTHFIMECRRA